MKNHTAVALIVAVLFVFSTPVFAQSTKRAPAKTAAKDPTNKQVKRSKDGFVNRVQERRERFRKIIRAVDGKTDEESRTKKIEKALSMATNEQSEFQRDAIEFLGEVRASGVSGELARVGVRQERVRDEVVLALSRILDKESVDFLIRALVDRRETIRSLALDGLWKYSDRDFGFYVDGNERELREGQKKWAQWWHKNRETFKPQVKNREEQQEANELWEKYGRDYLNRKK